MSAGTRTLFGALALADNINVAIAQRRSVDAARRAERSHYGSVAQLSAALAAIKKMDPEHPLNSQKVLDHIDAHGQGAGSFQAAWQVDCDPAEIYFELLESHQKARAKAVVQIEKSTISHREPGWFSNECFIFFSVKFDTLEAAQGAKEEALRLARSAGLDDSLDPVQILKAMVQKNLKLMEPVAVPRGPRPPARAFRRRKM